LTIPEDQLDDLKVVETIKEGVSIYKRPDKVSSLCPPAMFGVTLNEASCVCHDHGGGALVCGDGCFNHGLSVLVGAIHGGPSRYVGDRSRRKTTVRDDEMHKMGVDD
jgi:hypothetical protein